MSMMIILIVGAFLVFAMMSSKSDDEDKEKNGSQQDQDVYKARALMTPNEIEFFERLVKAFPNYYIFPQVAMSGLLDAKTNDGKKVQGIRNSFNRYRTDFVVYKDGKVLAIIELDDRTHKGREESDAKKDSMLKKAGYKILRFQSTNKPSIEQLQKLL